MKHSAVSIWMFLTTLLISCNVQSAEGLYLSGSLGVSANHDFTIEHKSIPLSLDVDGDSGGAFAVALGYGFESFRVEGEIAYQKTELSSTGVLGLSAGISGDVSNTGFLLNGYYDINNESIFTPYITGGIGAANVKGDDIGVDGLGIEKVSDSGTAFAYHLGFGVGADVHKNITLDLRYRYYVTSNLDIGDYSLEYTSHNVYAGVRFNF